MLRKYPNNCWSNGMPQMRFKPINQPDLRENPRSPIISTLNGNV